MAASSSLDVEASENTRYGWVMEFAPLECVVLTHDVADLCLCKGDLGTIVEVYEPDGLEVEFVKASGETQAVLLLTVADVRKVEPGDMGIGPPLTCQGVVTTWG